MSCIHIISLAPNTTKLEPDLHTTCTQHVAFKSPAGHGFAFSAGIKLCVSVTMVCRLLLVAPLVLPTFNTTQLFTLAVYCISGMPRRPAPELNDVYAANRQACACKRRRRTCQHRQDKSFDLIFADFFSSSSNLYLSSPMERTRARRSTYGSES